MDKSKSRLFLLEMVIIILFFSIAAAVCVNMFTKARMLGEAGGELTVSVLLAQEAAEIFRADGEAGLAREAAAGGEFYVFYYDEDGKPAPGGEEVAYVVTAELSGDSGVSSARISVQKDGRRVYEIETARQGGLDG